MELTVPVRVVVVDDRPDHLFAIANALAVSGVPCIWHLYDKASNQLVPAPPLEGYPAIRLIVSDLNIRDVTGGESDAKNLAGILLSDVLLPLLPKLPCPYGLVLWSNVQVRAEEVGEYITERIDHPNIPVADRRPAPLSVGLMDKSKFVSPLSATGPAAEIGTLMLAAVNGVADVRAQLSAALADPQLRLAFAWETRVSMAAASAVNSVYAAAEVHAASANLKRTVALRDVLVKLALEAAGPKDAKEGPARALDDGLVDVFVDNLRSTDSDSAYVAIVNGSMGDALGTAPPALSPAVRSRLNTELHVESRVSSQVKRAIRGVILGMEDDIAIEKFLGKKKASGVIWPEFLIGVDEFERAARDATANMNPDAQRLTDLHMRAVADKDEVEKTCRIRLMEIGADCDHAQRRARTVRLLCALEIPERFSYFLYQPRNSGALKSDSLLKLGPWVLDGSEGRLLLVSVGRFSILQEWPLPKELKPVYRLRKPLVDVVLHKYTSHSSRPGYVAITGA